MTEESGIQGWFVYKIVFFLAAVLLLAVPAFGGDAPEESLTFQLVRTADEEVLWESTVRHGDRFTIDYCHSSDHTPVHDLFVVDDKGEIVLLEERYRWYGAGLESHPAEGKTDFSGDWTRVFMYRPFPRFLLRIGETADPVLTIHGQILPLLSFVKGGDSIWIRVTQSSKVR